MQAWQEQKAKQMADEEAAAKAAEDEAVQWTFEDDSDEVRPLTISFLAALLTHVRLDYVLPLPGGTQEAASQLFIEQHAKILTCVKLEGCND